MQPELVGATVGVGYRIDAEISGGNMGMVYRATQLSVDRRVALKVIDQNRALNSRSVDRFFHEARIISKLEHPHIVRLYDFGRDEPHDLLYLVMEFIDGPTLNELLRTHRFKQQLVVEIGIQICRALIESHAQNVVHRDLKPANILLSRMSDGSLQLKVVDFGVARALETLDKQLTAEGAICGTPRYMPPEQARHGGKIDGRADLYALGLILYEMLCGYPPFDAEDAIELIFKHIKEPPRPLSTFLQPHELDRDLEMLTHELLSKSPSQRPADALQVLRRLELIQPQLPGQAGAIRLDSKDYIYNQLTPWMLPAVQEARAALVFGNTSQLGSDDLDMEPLETEWDHTHTVRVDLNSLNYQETQPFTSAPVPSLSWGGRGDEETLPPDQFDPCATQVTPAAAQPPSSGYFPHSNPAPHYSGMQPLVAAPSHASHLDTLIEDDIEVDSAPTHIVPAPIARPPRNSEPSTVTAAAAVEVPSRNKTLSGTLQALFFKFSGRTAQIAENTAENMFLNSSEEDLAALEARQLEQSATTERLLMPVMAAVVVCVSAVIGFVFWRAEQQQPEDPETLSRLDPHNAITPSSSREELVTQEEDPPATSEEVVEDHPDEEPEGLEFDNVEEPAEIEPPEQEVQDAPPKAVEPEKKNRSKSGAKTGGGKKSTTRPARRPVKKQTKKEPANDGLSDWIDNP